MSIRRPLVVTLTATSLLTGLVAAPALAAPPAPTPTVTSADVERVRAAVPADLQERIDAVLTAAGVERIDPTRAAAGTCGPSDLDRWMEQNVDATESELAILEITGATSVPMLEALLFGDVEGTNSFGVDGEHTKQITHAWKKLRTFWDEDSTEVRLTPMHGGAAADAERATRVFLALGLSEQEARDTADMIVDVVDTDRWQHGEHPLFTLNAFASSGEAMELQGLPAGPDSLIMGDGMLTVMDDLGLGEVAPQVILAHENTHHLQFDLGILTADVDPDTTPQEMAAQTRRTELQADAGAAYQATHPRGLTMRAWRVDQVLDTTHAIGDCMTDHPGHHGTPDQRRAATAWGVDVQEQARPRGKVMPSQEFTGAFDARLAQILAAERA